MHKGKVFMTFFILILLLFVVGCAKQQSAATKEIASQPTTVKYTSGDRLTAIDNAISEKLQKEGVPSK